MVCFGAVGVVFWGCAAWMCVCVMCSCVISVQCVCEWLCGWCGRVFGVGIVFCRCEGVVCSVGGFDVCVCCGKALCCQVGVDMSLRCNLGFDVA